MKSYSVVGNKKKVTMAVNATKLKVVGNSCIVKVTTNQGEIEVIGNECTVEVGDNLGTINLVGGTGLVSIIRRCPGDKVNLVGPACHLIVDGKKSRNSYEAQLSPMSPFSKDLDDVIESIFSFVMR